MARPLSQATTKQTLVARMRAGSQAGHRASTQFLGPTPASSTLHPASGGTMEILDPVHTKPAAHTTGHVVVRYGLVPTAREPVLNRQCEQSLGPWLHHTGAPKHPQVTTRGTPGPHRSHKRVFPQFLFNSRKRGFLYSRQRSHPILSEWTFPEHDI